MEFYKRRHPRYRTIRLEDTIGSMVSKLKPNARGRLLGLLITEKTRRLFIRIAH